MKRYLFAMGSFGMGSLLVAAAVTALIGCGTGDTTQTADVTQVSHDGDHGHVHGEYSCCPHCRESESPTLAASLANLAPTDQAAAKAQKTCPVSGEPLGSMGTPVKMHVGGKTVFICCEGCRDAVASNPAAYLNKLRR